MGDNSSSLKKLVLLKLKFLSASIIATSFDYLLYFLLYSAGLPKTTANFISYPISVILNFTLQKRYIFTMQRKLKTTFALAMLVSAGGWVLNSLLFYFFLRSPFFEAHHWVAKLCVTGIVFFYNFYGKRYVFEKRFL